MALLPNLLPELLPAATSVLSGAAASVLGLDAGNLWPDQLRPASYRGVPFFVRAHDRESGRRLAVFEFPLRDQAFVEDLGRRARRFRIAGYVMGDDYFGNRDALISACEDQAEPGLLVHPYLGEFPAFCASVRVREEQAEGRIVFFEFEFVEAGDEPSPVGRSDTAATVLAAADDVVSALGLSFQSLFTAAGGGIAIPDFVSAAGTGVLAQFGLDFAPMLGASGLDLSAVSPLLTELTGAASLIPSDALGIANLVNDLIGGYGAAVLAALDLGASATPSATLTPGGGSGADWSPASVDPGPASASSAQASYVASSRGPAPSASSADPSWGLAVFAAWGASLAAPGTATSNRVLESANQQAIVDLVNGAAVAAIAQVYAATDWPSSTSADAARSQMSDLIDARITAADAAGADTLVLAWGALASTVAADLTARAKQAQQMRGYQIAQPLPSLVLAHRLYQDGSRGDELVAENDVPHPAFMPLAGTALVA